MVLVSAWPRSRPIFFTSTGPAMTRTRTRTRGVTSSCNTDGVGVGWNGFGSDRIRPEHSSLDTHASGLSAYILASNA
jgi:hypothetical protein